MKVCHNQSDAPSPVNPPLPKSELTEQMLSLQKGDHLCLFYEKDPMEQLPALVPFIQEGLAHDEQFIYIADDQSVEDNEDDVVIMQRAFQKAGVTNPLQCVSDGQKAMAYLEGKGNYSDRQRYILPLIILLDLSMPRMNGHELLQWLRQHPTLRRTTVHVLTASTRGEDVEKAFDAGANAYIVKPSKFEALVEMVKAWHILAKFAAFPALSSGSGSGGTGAPSIYRSALLAFL